MIRRRWRRSSRLLRRIQRCVDDGRLVVDDVHLAGEAVWASVHGHMMIELTGYFESMDRDARRAFAEGMRLLALGLWRSARGTRRLDARRLAQVAAPRAWRRCLRCGEPGERRSIRHLALRGARPRRSASAGMIGVAATAIALAVASCRPRSSLSSAASRPAERRHGAVDSRSRLSTAMASSNAAVAPRRSNSLETCGDDRLDLGVARALCASSDVDTAGACPPHERRHPVHDVAESVGQVIVGALHEPARRVVGVTRPPRRRGRTTIAARPCRTCRRRPADRPFGRSTSTA